MNKKTIIIIICIAVPIIAVAVLAATGFFKSEVKLSTPYSVGNTAGNLYNNGFFCENGKYIYFANPYDEYTLYRTDLSMTKFEKISNDSMRYINCDSNYIYYCRTNNLKKSNATSPFKLFSTGLYRIKHDGSDMTDIITNPVGCILNFNNKLYFQNGEKNKDITICSIGIDGENLTKILTDDCLVASAHGDNIYFADLLTSHSIRQIGPNDNLSQLSGSGAYLPIATDRGVTYINTADKYSIYLDNYEFNNPQKIIQGPVSSYNFAADDRLLFFQLDDGDASGIKVYDFDTMQTTDIYPGNFRFINVAGDFCFFFQFENDMCYAYNYKSGALFLFQPPILK